MHLSPGRGRRGAEGWGQEEEASGQGHCLSAEVCDGPAGAPGHFLLHLELRACVPDLMVRKGWETGEASGSVSVCPLLAELAGVCLFCCGRRVPAQWSVPPPRPGLSGTPLFLVFGADSTGWCWGLPHAPQSQGREKTQAGAG